MRHAIEIALDFARMPALARFSDATPIPPNITELMRIAAASPNACHEASAATGEPVPVLVEAARFYLQHLLLRPEAGPHRVLGLQPGASRATARAHMSLLLRWLHPDRNSGVEAVYAERVVKAWREVSSAAEAPSSPPRPSSSRTRRGPSHFRLPWIPQRPVKPARKRSVVSYLVMAAWAASVLVLLGVTWSVVDRADSLALLP